MKKFFIDMDTPVNENIVAALKHIFEQSKPLCFEVFTLSAIVGPTSVEAAKARLTEYCPYIDQQHQIFIPYGQNKATFVSAELGISLEDCFLLDDDEKNISNWKEAGGHSVRLFDNTSKKSGYFDGPYTCAWVSPQKICEDILRIIGARSDERVLAVALQLMEENKHNFSYAAKGFDEGYASGYQDALVDILSKLGWPEKAEEIGYIN